jgi:hypothetical protein
MRTSILFRTLSFNLLVGILISAESFAETPEFAIDKVNPASNAICGVYFSSGANADINRLHWYGEKADISILSANQAYAKGSSEALTGQGSAGATQAVGLSEAAKSAVQTCQSKVNHVIHSVQKCNLDSKSIANVRKIIAEIEKSKSEGKLKSCDSSYITQFSSNSASSATGVGMGNAVDGSQAAPKAGGTENKGVLAKTGGFLKDNAMPILVGGAVGLGAYALLGDDDNKRAPASTNGGTTDGTTDGETEGETEGDNSGDNDGGLTIDTPPNPLVQTDLFTKVPTEQTNPVTSTATATEHDPAYTGVGSNQGDTSGNRDGSAGEFVTSFTCFEGESDAACRRRYGCTANEALSTCQARWDSGLISVPAIVSAN